MKEVNDLLKTLGELEDAPLIWINEKVYDMAQEIKRLKEDYMMLQNASDEAEEEKDKEIGRLTAESTKWESKFYDEAKKVDRAIKYMEDNSKISLDDCVSIINFYRELLSILKGVDRE